MTLNLGKLTRHVPTNMVVPGSNRHQTNAQDDLKVCFLGLWWISDVAGYGARRHDPWWWSADPTWWSTSPAMSTCISSLNLMNFEQTFLHSINFHVHVELGQLNKHNPPLMMMIYLYFGIILMVNNDV